MFPRPAPTFLAALSEDSQPQAAALCAKRVQTRTVAGYGVVVEPSLHNRPQPLAYIRYLLMHEALQPSLDLVQLRAHALGSRLTLDRKRPSPCLPAQVREAEK